MNDKGRTLTAVLLRAPAMDAQIDPILSQVNAFSVQACALFGPGRSVGWQA